jgi:NAD(P)-dependent dehydrogenase (short-subunit alcohol dehydrogenase family)
MTALRLDGRVAIVTGAGRGMGAAIARELARRGASVVVNDLGSGVDGVGADDGPAAEVTAAIVAAGGRAAADSHTVSTGEGADAIVARAISSFGQLDVVVNNAGIIKGSSFPETDIDDLMQHLSVHLVGSFNVSRAAWPHMVRSGYGRIVLMTSSAVFGSAVSISYAAAKAGQIGLMRTLALVGREHGIKVNAVAPVADTRMSATREQRGADPAPRRPPELVSQAIALLAHDTCPVTGEIFGVGGGKADRLLLAVTEGHVDPGEFTAERLDDSWEQVMDARCCWLPIDSFDHVRRLTQPAAAPRSGSGVQLRPSPRQEPA